MKTSLLVIGLLVLSVSVALAQHLNNAQIVGGSVLHGSSESPEQFRQRAFANEQAKRQQILITAQKAAAQAADYAKQAAAFNNTAARQAAGYAAQAAASAKEASLYVNGYYINSPTFEEYAANAGEAAANAKKAAGQAEVDSAVSKLESERDETIAKINAKYAPGISDLHSKNLTLKASAAQLESQRSQSERENAHLRAKQLFQPKDPWRLLDGKIYNAKDVSWVQFSGQVLEVKPNGILMDGDFGPPLEAGFGKREYFVENFPVQSYPPADGETITPPMNFVAHLGEKSSIYRFTNTTIDLRAQTVRRLDYGKVVESPPPDLAKEWNNIIVIAGDANPQITKQLNDNEKEQAAVQSQLSQLNSDSEKEQEPIIAEYKTRIDDVPNVIAKQAKEKDAAKKQAVTDKVLKSNQDAADRGDAYGLFRMGERYRDGEGVTKDLAKAREYLAKAAAAGSTTAAGDLKKLPASQN
jgi:hypothetical protein